MNLPNPVYARENMSHLQFLYLDELAHQIALRCMERGDAVDRLRQRAPVSMLSELEYTFKAIDERASTVDELLMEMCFKVGAANLREIEKQFTPRELELLGDAFLELPHDEAGRAIMRIAELPPDHAAALLRTVLTEEVS